MDEKGQCQGFGKVLATGIKTPRGAMLPPEPFLSQKTSPEWVEERSGGSKILNTVITKLGSAGHKLSESSRRGTPSS
jgi:hypothetical protein